MRKSIGIFFLALYFLALLRPVAPWIEYYANKGYIQQFLCINQDKPKMACAGKCHLQKRITETNDTDDENLPSRINLEDYPLSVLATGGWQISQVAQPPCVLNGAYQNGYEFLMSNAPFHPPQLILVNKWLTEIT
ncbi:MAG TPA: hypothetical protein DCS93_17825 [Microscillaceae bacterium]|nr:hypothetical protein [Microscillaceae bacterium]